MQRFEPTKTSTSDSSKSLYVNGGASIGSCLARHRMLAKAVAFRIEELPRQRKVHESVVRSVDAMVLSGCRISDNLTDEKENN